MASLNMAGPFPIWAKNEKNELIKNTGNVVGSDIVFGNYAFGNDENDGFHIFYVGRSTSGLLTEINQQIDKGKAKGCEHFKYSIANNATEAYEKECQNYHDFNPPRNDIHPAKPKDNGHYKCPVDGCEYHE